MKIQNQIDQKGYKSEKGFIYDYQRLIKEVVLPYQYSVLCDKAEGNNEKSHVIQNFINAGSVLAGKGAGDGFYGMVFQDSDAAKWLEAAAYSLVIFPDKKLEKTADDLIDIIAAAQDKDGYLNTYFTIKDTEKRWQNICEGHELYCAGHMMEAACAYYEATGKRKLLEVMLKNVECIHKVFMEGDDFMQQAFPGHPEVELALMKMYRLTGEKKCYELAKHFVDVRGVDSHHFEKEVAKRDWSVWGTDGKNPAYNQADMPVRQQKDAKGHAVRAVYLYTGMADVAGVAEDAELDEACRRLWESITRKQMYITGGIGSTGLGEAFSVDYDLPNDTAYCETCASIGLIFFASRMLEKEVNREYSDVMERAFYNTVLAGMQLDGKKFFYVNPLEVVPGIAGIAPTHRHDLPQRPTWYACACCPPNTARLISSFGKYAYGENQNTVYCHLFAAGTVDFSNGTKIKCTTEYPYDMKIKYEILEGETTLAVRIPGWSKKYKVSLNGIDITDSCFIKLEKGYAYITVKQSDTVIFELDSTPYFVYPNPKVPDLSGQAAVCRGPLVYCAEGTDNNNDILALSLDTKKTPKAEKFDTSLLKGTVVVEAKGFRTSEGEGLYFTERPEKEMTAIKMVPYYTWGNRGLNQMKIWFPQD